MNEETMYYIRKTDTTNSQVLFETPPNYTAKQAEGLLRSWRAYAELKGFKHSYECFPARASEASPTNPPVARDETLVYCLYCTKTGEYRGFVRTQANIPACYNSELVPIWQCLEFKQSA